MPQVAEAKAGNKNDVSSSFDFESKNKNAIVKSIPLLLPLFLRLVVQHNIKVENKWLASNQFHRLETSKIFFPMCRKGKENSVKRKFFHFSLKVRQK